MRFGIKKGAGSRWKATPLLAYSTLFPLPLVLVH